MFKNVMMCEEKTEILASGKDVTTEKPQGKDGTTEKLPVKVETKEKQATVKVETFNPDVIKVFSNFNEFMDLIMND